MKMEENNIQLKTVSFIFSFFHWHMVITHFQLFKIDKYSRKNKRKKVMPFKTVRKADVSSS